MNLRDVEKLLADGENGAPPPDERREVEAVLDAFSTAADDTKKRNITLFRRLLNLAKKVGADPDAIRFTAYDARPGFMLEVVRSYGRDPSPRMPGEYSGAVRSIHRKTAEIRRMRKSLERRRPSEIPLELDDEILRMYDAECDLSCQVMAFVDHHLLSPPSRL